MLLAGYGDSMTDLATPGWLDGVSAAYTVTDKGVPGEFGTTAGWNRLAADAPAMTQDYVVAMWGTNDIAVEWPDAFFNSQVWEPFQQGCRRAVAAVQARGIPLVLMVPPPFGANPGQAVVETALRASRRTQIRSFYLTAFPTVPVIDLSGIDASTYILGNNVHFTAEGITYVAGLVEEMLGLIRTGAESMSPGSGGTWPTTQDGYTAADGSWSGTSTTMTLPANGSRLGGTVFAGFPVTTATRIRPPSPIYTSRQTYISTKLQLTTTSSAAGTLTVRMTPDVVPPPFWSGYLPSTLGTSVFSGSYYMNGKTRVELSTPGVKLIPLDLGQLTLRYRRPQWQGAWAFSLQWVGAGDLVLATRQTSATAGPVMVVESVSEMSGIQGDVKAQSRVDRCPRCSRPSIREEWVVDGYSKTFVCKDCFDPADPLWYRRVPRPVRPGINDAG